MGVRVLCAGHFSEQIRGRISISHLQAFLYCPSSPPHSVQGKPVEKNSRKKGVCVGGKVQDLRVMRTDRNKAKSQPPSALLTGDGRLGRDKAERTEELEQGEENRGQS